MANRLGEKLDARFKISTRVELFDLQHVRLTSFYLFTPLKQTRKAWIMAGTTPVAVGTAMLGNCGNYLLCEIVPHPGFCWV